jgi:mannose PTS system EIIA component
MSYGNGFLIRYTIYDIRHTSYVLLTFYVLPFYVFLMIGVLVLTHGRLAEALLDSAERIAAEKLPFRTLAIDWNLPFEDIRRTVGEAIAEADRGRGVIVLTDLFGGTPTNVALSFLRERPGVEVITGANLPMLVKLATLHAQEGVTLRDAARELAAKGAQSIHLLTEYLDKKG